MLHYKLECSNSFNVLLLHRMQQQQHTAKKLLFVSNSCWSMYNFRKEVLESFIADGFEVHVLAQKDDFAAGLMNIGCKVHHIEFNNRELNPIADITLFWQLRKFYKKLQPIAIFHYVIKPNIYGSLAAGWLRIPSVALITGLGYAFKKRNWLFVLVQNLYRFALRRVKEVWLLNAEDVHLFQKYRIAKPSKLKLLHGEGINTERFDRSRYNDAKADKPFVFLMLTRNLWSKGIGTFADAARILRSKGYHFQCRIFGFFEPHHPDSIPVEQMQAWRDEGLIDYRGFANDVVPCLLQSHCFVLPSYYQEGVPRSLMEACSLEIPIITTNHTGCREVVDDGVNGFMCKVDNAEDLAVKMAQLMSMPEAGRKAMGQAGRTLVQQKFDVKKIISEYKQFVAKVQHRS
ncbi:MAG TPA: glycosyl transferase [Chitinophagaceae bacterium]|nr:glycosyl transferase [Chitinophagaceae bacterium]HAN38034.1 glycosyl transferase [Chitinophagaceae bacterium]